MRLKSFQAKTMQEALKQIKETLGDDAIIVSTKEESSGWVRITAAIEQQPMDKAPERPIAAPAPEATPQLNAKTAAAAAVASYDEDTVTEIITDTLLKHRVPSSVSDKIISAAMTYFSGDPKKTLARALDKTFTFSTTAPQRQKPLMLVGAPGAGKTLMTAKLAADAVMQGKRPAVITTDIARAGGVEQLSAFLNIMNLPLHQAEDAETLKKVIGSLKGADPIIIDTGGLNPFDPVEMKFLARLIAVCDMHPAMVLAAGIDAEEAAEMAMTFEILGVKELIPTRLDFARRIGGILSAAERAGLGFYRASHTPQVANGIVQMTPELLADMLLPHLPRQEENKADDTPAKAKRGTK